MTENAAPKPITLRLPADTDRMVRSFAKTDRRSLNAELIVLLELGMREMQGHEGPEPMTVDEARGIDDASRRRFAEWVDEQNRK